MSEEEREAPDGAEPEQQEPDEAVPHLWAGEGAGAAPPPRPRPARQRPAPAPPAKRPVRKRPAPEPVATAAARRRRAAAAAEASSGPVHRDMPRWWWLLAFAETAFLTILLVDWLTGWSDPPSGCFSSVCSTGQGVAILALIGSIVFGLAVVVGLLLIAMGAAKRPARSRPKPERLSR